jgi:hypothetical protein
MATWLKTYLGKTHTSWETLDREKEYNLAQSNKVPILQTKFMFINCKNL